MFMCMCDLMQTYWLCAVEKSVNKTLLDIWHQPTIIYTIILTMFRADYFTFSIVFTAGNNTGYITQCILYTTVIGYIIDKNSTDHHDYAV